jgi:hypothetical protein
METENEIYLIPEDRESLGQTNYKRFLAFQRLGIRPQDVEIVPLFREQLRDLARCSNRERHKGKGTQPGSPIGPFSYLEQSSDPDARRVLEAYKSVPGSYRRLLPPEAFCLAAGIPPARVLEIIAAVVVKEGARIAAVRAAVAQERVLSKTVDRALQDGGWRERLLIFKSTGLVPSWGWRGTEDDSESDDDSLGIKD